MHSSQCNNTCNFCCILNVGCYVLDDAEPHETGRKIKIGLIKIKLFDKLELYNSKQSC